MAQHNEHEKILAKAAAEDGIFSKIHDVGIERYVADLAGVEKAFELADRDIRCMDEGTPGAVCTRPVRVFS